MGLTKILIMKTLLLIFFLFLSLRLFAPEYKSLFIAKDNSIKPFEAIWKAVCKIESENNPLKLNILEGAYGIAQIRQIRLTHFKAISGINYSLTDMYSPEKSRAVFMVFAERIGPYNQDRIIRNWNGSGKQTYEYLKRVKNELK
jgi:hypothetical protein